METKRKLGKYLAELRISKGLAKSELAERTGVSENTVDRWESGRALPGRDDIDRLAGVLNVNADELINSTSHAPLPETGSDLSYEQQQRKTENTRYLILLAFIILAYIGLYLLATRTSILAGLFPALIALTITVMIAGLFILGKAIHGSLYTRTDLRKYLLAAFCLIIVPLTLMDWINYEVERERQGQTDVPVSIEVLEEYTGLDLDGCQVIFSYENSGWFGSGTRVYELACDDEAIVKQLEGSDLWKKLPADETFRKLVSENIHYGPDSQSLPEVSEGYWYIAANTGDEVIYIADPEAGIRDFIAALYDSSAHVLYIARYSS